MLKLPKHLTLTISHNEHKNYYETAEQYYGEFRSGVTWVPGTSRQRAFEANDVWEIQVYPDTPVGYYVVAGATLEEVLAFVNGDPL